jgi:hypothetical protein
MDLFTKIDVFLSRKSEDAHLAKEIYDFLTSKGLKVFDSDQSLPELGNADFSRVIDDVLEKTEHLIVIGSSINNITSPWVEAEWRFFLNRKRAGKIKGNLLTIIEEKLQKDSLPASLQNYEIVPFNKYKEKILNYVGIRNIDRVNNVPIISDEEILLAHENLEEEKIKKLKISNEDIFKRYDLIKKLSAELLIDDSKKTEKKSVFISYAFDNPLWYGLAKRKIEELNLDLTSGKNLGSTHNSIREALKDRIEKSNFFLGIWTKSNGIQTIDKKWLPSQWLMWEFGIAVAKNKKWRLLISKDIDENAYKEIYNDIPHLLFNETDEIESFETAFLEAIEYFKIKSTKQKYKRQWNN